MKMEIRVNGVLVNNIRYADKTVLIAGNVNELQQLVNVVLCRPIKTKFMIVIRDLNAFENVSLTEDP